jgi:hypothetical protein
LEVASLVYCGFDQSVKFLVSYSEALNSSTSNDFGAEGNTNTENRAEYKGKKKSNTVFGM